MDNIAATAFLQKTCYPTLEWLRNSISNNQGHGSSAFFSLFSGWAPPYPETTGYIIPTLFDYAAALNDQDWSKLAKNCSQWLCSIQSSNGAFSQDSRSEKPLVFDTGMILFGLSRSFQETGHVQYLEAIQRATYWLEQVMEPQGFWLKFAYVPGFAPAYHSRVIWAVLKANTFIQDRGLTDKMRSALHYHTRFFLNTGGICNAGLRPGAAATTHTLAYFLRGMLESAMLLNDSEVQKKVIKVVEILLFLRAKQGRIAGSYDENWQGNYNFICITGHAQLSILMSRLYQISGNPVYQNGSTQLFKDILRAPAQIPKRGIQGGIAGSMPIWGAYQPFRWLNWAAKFYLDAALSQAQFSEHPPTF